MTIWRAYRAARARANWNVHDRESFRKQRLFEERLIARIGKYDDVIQALNEYGQHTLGCSGKYPEYHCKCGWRETAEALGVSEGPEK